MSHQYYFTGITNAVIRHRLVEIPEQLKTFYVIRSRYMLAEHETGGHKYLAVCPRKEWKELFGENVNHFNLETIVKDNGKKLLKLPPSSIRYLDLGKDNAVKIIGCGNWFEIWKPEDYENWEEQYINTLTGINAK